MKVPNKHGENEKNSKVIEETLGRDNRVGKGREEHLNENRY
jgi:hypothetical protein